MADLAQEMVLLVLQVLQLEIGVVDRLVGGLAARLDFAHNLPHLPVDCLALQERREAVCEGDPRSRARAALLASHRTLKLLPQLGTQLLEAPQLGGDGLCVGHGFYAVVYRIRCRRLGDAEEGLPLRHTTFLPGQPG